MPTIRPVLIRPRRRRRRGGARPRRAGRASARSGSRAAPARYMRGTVSTLWENTSGAAARTMSRASGTPRKSGVSTSTAVSAVALVDGVDDGGEVAGAAVGEVVAVDRGDDGVAQPHGGHRLGDVVGLVDVDPGRRSPRGDGAEPAAAGADVAQDHEGGGAVLPPTLVDVGAAGLLADGVEVEAVDEAADLVVLGGGGELDAQPVGAAAARRAGGGGSAFGAGSADLNQGLGHRGVSLSRGGRRRGSVRAGAPGGPRTAPAPGGRSGREPAGAGRSARGVGARLHRPRAATALDCEGACTARGRSSPSGAPARRLHGPPNRRLLGRRAGGLGRWSCESNRDSSAIARMTQKDRRAVEAAGLLPAGSATSSYTRCSRLRRSWRMVGAPLPNRQRNPNEPTPTPPGRRGTQPVWSVTRSLLDGSRGRSLVVYRCQN